MGKSEKRTSSGLSRFKGLRRPEPLQLLARHPESFRFKLNTTHSFEPGTLFWKWTFKICGNMRKRVVKGEREREREKKKKEK